MRIPENHWLKNSNIAHRGLHNSEMPENSMSAFKAGMAKGYPIEIDVHLTTDGKVIIFHDHNAKRVCGVDVEIESLTYAEVQELKLCGTEEGIPLLSELTQIATTPILCELKNLTRNIGPLESETLRILQESGVDFAIQSFNPYSIVWYCENAPEVLRGQLSSFYDEQKRCFRRYMLKAMLLNRKSKPDFISYDQSNMPNKYVTKYCKKHTETARLAWTIRTQERIEELSSFVDSFIFELFIPKEEPSFDWLAGEKQANS